VVAVAVDLVIHSTKVFPAVHDGSVADGGEEYPYTGVPVWAKLGAVANANRTAVEFQG
jgi:hypothetical protein